MSNINALLTQSKDPNPDVRRSAVKALAKSEDSRAAAPLITALQDGSELVRGCALQGLKDIGPPAVPLLIDALKNPDRRVRRKASCVIDNIGYELKDIGDFQSALADPVASVRRHAIAALEKTGSKRAIPQLEKMARDEPEDSVRQAAKRALRKRRD